MTDAVARLSASLADRYTIERELGGGGMSRVFVANETALNRSVVIKVIAPALVDGMSTERFAREVKLAARLQHANIVPVLAAGEAGGLPYYTMPYVRGESLRARLASAVPVPLPEAVHVLRDVARALAYAHGEGVVHRDIKPENILLSGGAAVVTDFGIAKAIDLARTQDGDHGGAVNITLTQAGSSLGTPAYMAPEQATGDPNVDHRADIYAWGLIAWELLAGRHPFSGRTSLQAVIAAQITETPPALTTVRTDTPPALSELVARCLAKDRARRPASATEVLAALDQAVSTGSRGAAAPVGSGRRRRVIVAGAALGGLVVIGLGMWITHGHAGATDSTHLDKSLAVIPFASLGSDTANAYLAEGLGEDVTNTLSQIPGLRLAGQSSAATFARKQATAHDIGRALQVSQVLQGTVRREGDDLRVSVELSDVSTGRVIWHESYQHAASDARAVEDEIARAIAGQLQVTLTSASGSAAGGTSDAEAYDLYLKGMYLYRRRGAGVAEAVADLEQATIRDSMFARAWADLSDVLTVSPYYVDTRVGEVLPRARAAAERAVRLDSSLSEAHLALGYAHAEAFEWPAAESEIRRAIALDPSAAEPRYRLGYVLYDQGRIADAIPELQQAVARDPLYFLPLTYLGRAEIEAGRIPEGLAEERRALALEPNAITAITLLAVGSLQAGLPDSAAYYAHRVLTVSRAPGRIGCAAFILARAGRTAEARTLLKQLEALPAGAWNRWNGLANAYNGLRDTTRMLDALEHAAQGDGDAMPTYFIRLGGVLPPGSRSEAVLQRYHLDPARFIKGAQ